jgi:hypothetical protein
VTERPGDPPDRGDVPPPERLPVPAPGKPADRPGEPSPPDREPERLPERRSPGGVGPVAAPTSRYAPRFRVILGGLIGIALGAVGATLLLAGGKESGTTIEGRWSIWKPSSSNTNAAQEIADHVAPLYKGADGDQLVGATGGPLKVGDLNLPVRIAVNTSPSGGRIAIARGKAVLYTLCGLGPRCAINRGKPSVERFLLLRREAFELALYSFRYLKGVKNVVVLLPPAPGQRPQNAAFFQKDGIADEVFDRPLQATLPSPPPSVEALEDSEQAALISRLTQPSVFCFSFEQAQDLSAVLVLQRPTRDARQPCRNLLGSGSTSGSGTGGTNSE